MADYAAIRDGLKTRLETISALTVVYDNVPDRVVVPCAVVAPGSPIAQYHQSGNDSGALTQFNFDVIVLVQHWEPNAAQDRIDAVISGAGSVETAIEGNKVLGGAASTWETTQSRGWNQAVLSPKKTSRTSPSTHLSKAVTLRIQPAQSPRKRRNKTWPYTWVTTRALPSTQSI
jgi:hypothetical protein